ncbi:hypothetical protein [Paenirhodobacter populi]|uniref:hypothetical protein n=1 Tax=Paenirhodobacter populi TaxID=2306993 RepID=UPI0013E2AE8E|nr:hypothetical protein [Sinirhodobacter populi]
MSDKRKSPVTFLAQGDSGVTYTVTEADLTLRDGRRLRANGDGTWTILETGEILTRR